ALNSLALAGSAGVARRISPIHTPVDGDICFALSTAAEAEELGLDVVLGLGAAAAYAVEQAIERAVIPAARAWPAATLSPAERPWRPCRAALCPVGPGPRPVRSAWGPGSGRPTAPVRAARWPAARVGAALAWLPCESGSAPGANASGRADGWGWR